MSNAANLLKTPLALALSLCAAASFNVEAGQVNASGLKEGDRINRFIVKYKAGSPEAKSMRALNKELSKVSKRQSMFANVRGTPGGNSAAKSPTQLRFARNMSMGGTVLTTNKSLNYSDAVALMNDIARNPRVEYVEPDVMMKRTFTPNDTQFNGQWGLISPTAGVQAVNAWDVARGNGVVIAVLDTGITSHPDLNDNILRGYDFISNLSVANDGNLRDADPSDPGDWVAADECGAGEPADNSSWHGSHVAGIAAAHTNNADGIAGTAFQAKIMPVRVLGKCGGLTSDIADGIVWASGGSVPGVPDLKPEFAADIINMSLGGRGECSAVTQNSINQAVANGVVVVVAAGNDSQDALEHRPANCQNVITVASVTQAGAKSGFSNFGTSIDVSAPGSGILSTINAGTTVPTTPAYANYSGTSMATPMVAGVVALIQSHRTAVGLLPYTPAEMEALLKSTAYPLPGACTQGCGAGIVSATAALNAVTAAAPPVPPTVISNRTNIRSISGRTGSNRDFVIDVPAGASNLFINTQGGGGDVDLYVRAGNPPTDAVYDCRPRLAGNGESCSFPTPAATSYYVRLKGFADYSAVSLQASFVPRATQEYGNATNTNIPDATSSGGPSPVITPGTVTSSLTVSGRPGNGSNGTIVFVDIKHTYRGDLALDLIAPDGTAYALKSSDGDSRPDLIARYKVDVSSELMNGTWTLRAQDQGPEDIGFIDNWSITF